MDTEEKVRENRLRRMAERQGLRLEKSRSRDKWALGYGTYRLLNATTGNFEAGGFPEGYGMTLDAVERFLTHQ